MYTLSAPAHTEYIIKKSRFIGIAVPCTSETQAQATLAGLRQRYADANHIAYAYRILTPDGWRYRIHDANEPSGTAGKPIFAHLEGKQLVNVLVAVVRYFGGIKLGAGGLARAYGQSAGQTLEQATKQPFVRKVKITLRLPYELLDRFLHHLKTLDADLIDQTFTSDVTLTLALPEAQLDQLGYAYQCLDHAVPTSTMP
ncbi:MAG: YigZ family protein [Methylococcales bacterium]|nr:YigZ family protein [Methylococcales bacterium]